MQKQRLQKTMYMAVIASEASHVFCCALPTVFSVLSLLAGLGMITAMPGWLHGMHSFMHGWEVPLIFMSGAVIALGWALHVLMQRGHDHEHCSHGGCAPKKQGAATVLKIATVLFVVNVLVYAIFHRGVALDMHQHNVVHAVEHDHGHGE